MVREPGPRPEKLPSGIIGTLEAIYSKDINAVVYRNYNLLTPTQRLTDADNRQIYPAAGPRLNLLNGPNGQFTFLDVGVIGLENTNQDYQYSFTGQLRKEFANGFLTPRRSTPTRRLRISPRTLARLPAMLSSACP